MNFNSAGYHGNGTCKPNFNYISAVIGWSLPLCESFIQFWNGAWNGSMVIFWCSQRTGARFTNVLSVKKFVSSFLRTVCVSQTPSTYEFLKDFAKIFLNIVVTLRQGGGGDLIFQKIS